MALMDVTVIYFAFGSPLGVYQITREPRPTRRAAAFAAVYVVLWPLFTFAFLRQWFLSLQSPQEADLERQIERIRCQFEALLFDKRSTSTIFEFREVFARFAGLSLALKQQSSIDFRQELFRIGGRKQPRVAQECARRRDRKLLIAHQAQAHAEFTDMTIDLMRSQPSNVLAIQEISERLVSLLDDKAI